MSAPTRRWQRHEEKMKTHVACIENKAAYEKNIIPGVTYPIEGESYSCHTAEEPFIDN